MCIVLFVVVVVFAQRSHSQNGSRKGSYKERIKKKKKLVHDLSDKQHYRIGIKVIENNCKRKTVEFCIAPMFVDLSCRVS